MLDACLACGGPLGAPQAVPAAEPALAGQPFALRICRECGSALTVGAAPEQAHDVGAYRPGRPRLAGLAAPLLRHFDRVRLALLARHVVPSGRLLDVGAGRGRFVAAARAAGWEADGIEPSVRGVSGARDEYGVVLAPVGIETAEIAPGSLHAVTLWHVLEHLDDPQAALRRIGGWLADGGVLLVGVPNRASLQARLGGPRWYHLDVPRHRIHLTPDGLEALLAGAGFRTVAVTHRLLEHNPFGLWQSLVNRLTRHPSYLFNLLKRNVPLDGRDLAVTVLALPFAPLAAALEWLAGAAGWGGTVAAVAVRGEPTPATG